jgi:hypothetical protein
MTAHSGISLLRPSGMAAQGGRRDGAQSQAESAYRIACKVGSTLRGVHEGQEPMAGTSASSVVASHPLDRALITHVDSILAAQGRRKTSWQNPSFTRRRTINQGCGDCRGWSVLRRVRLLAAALVVCGSPAAAVPVRVALDWPSGRATSGLPRARIQAIRTAGRTQGATPVDAEAAPDGRNAGPRRRCLARGGVGAWLLERRSRSHGRRPQTGERTARALAGGVAAGRDPHGRRRPAAA